jgi:glycolate oxidase FAD binding subunit
VSAAPEAIAEAADLLAAASREGRRLRPVGGGTRSRTGAPDPSVEPLSTTGLRRVVEHLPADLTVTVEAGIPAADLAELVGAAGQTWPQAELRPGSTVGGVLAAAASGRGRLRYGPVRDSLLEVVLVTGDGRVVKGGGRTVKGVAGYDLPRMAVGSGGTLGLIAQVTLKLWPTPPASGWFATGGTLDERLAVAEGILRDVHRPAALLLGPDRLSVRLDGYPEDLTAPTGTEPIDEPPAIAATGLARAGVPPTTLPDLARAFEAEGMPYEAALGVGTCLVAVERPEDVARVRALATAARGHAVVTDAPEALRTDPWGPAPAGLSIMRRLKDAFDPAGVLGPIPAGVA